MTVAALVVATRVATGITALVARGRKAAAAFVTAAVAAVTAAVAAFVTGSFVAASGKGATGLEGMRRATRGDEHVDTSARNLTQS